LDVEESVRYVGILLRCAVHADGHEEGALPTHQVGALFGEPPLEAEVPFPP
jgi:hypothetical protein